MPLGSCVSHTGKSVADLSLPYLLVIILYLLPAVGDQLVHVKKWRALGPFVIGKNELDGEPWRISNISELVTGGKVRWTNFQAEKNGHLSVQWGPNVEWQSLVDGVGGHELLEWQALLKGVFKTGTTGPALLSCQGVSAFYVDNRPIPIVGDQYQTSLVSQSMWLAAGSHKITVRLRAKVRASLGCSIQLMEHIRPRIFGGSFFMAPDVVDGILASDLLSVPVLNSHPRQWLVNPKLTQAKKSDMLLLRSDQPSEPSIAPGQSAILTARIVLGQKQCPKDKDRLQIVVQGEQEGQLVASAAFTFPTLRCRRRQQSFVFTFMDVDGSVQHAAAVAPESAKACWQAGCPVVLTLHGTSISASDSADSYKVKFPGDADYRFGVRNAWLLAPTRGGAHNWEGPGRATAFAALRALPNVAARLGAPAADVDRVLFAGHSMGGHGAWLLAIGARDAAIGLVTSASWLRKDRYADSNKPFLHDVGTPDVEPALQALLKAAESEFDVEEHAAMLAGGLHILARVGEQDKTVHPWFSRRMLRHLLSHGAALQEVTLTEVHGKEHWWWDTQKSNDGGVVNDQQMRDFYEVCIKKPSGAAGLPAQWKLVLYNPATSSTKGGARVVQQLVPLRRSEVAVRVVKSGNVQMEVQTANIRRLEWSVPAFQQLMRKHRDDHETCKKCVVELDGQAFEVDSSSSHISWCDVGLKWDICRDDADFIRVQRSPATLGPMRQLFSAASCAVIGDGDEVAEQAATFVANLQVMTAYSQLRILNASSVVGNDGGLTVPIFCKHLLVIGTPETNPMASVLLQPRPALGYETPLKVSSASGISVGSCSWPGSETAALTLLPWWPSSAADSAPALALLATGTSSHAAAAALSLLATPTIPPMTRQPLTHLLPDYVVLDLPEVRLRGAGGFLAAGFWGHRWQLEPRASWERACRTPVSSSGTPERSVREEL